MIQIIELKKGLQLNDYAEFAHLSAAVRELRLEAQMLLPKLNGRTVWMVNSTAAGGGVAEMLPRVVGIFRDLGVQTNWIVMGVDDPKFFNLTKRLHNLIHDFGRPGFSDQDRKLYNRTSKKVAAELEGHVKPEDLLVIHDPQPLGAGAELKKRTGVRAIWRCHIGLDHRTEAPRSAWDFLKPHAEVYDHAIFSAPEYIPRYFLGRASILYPAIDPLSHKNRELSVYKLAGILCNAGLMKSHYPVVTPSWKHRAMRLQPDGTFIPASEGLEIGLMFRPVITQISRWDRLKGWEALLKAFIALKKQARKRKGRDARHQRLLKAALLVLAGPDPSEIQDDPEGKEVLKDLCDFYKNIKREEQESVALLTLPMAARKENHLMVNTLQRCSTIVVQNSLQEGFGLTVTEAMWKRIPVLGTSACGLRKQIRDGIDGRLTQNPLDPDEIAENMDNMLAEAALRDMWGRNAQRRVYDRFLVFSQVQEWLVRLADLAGR